MTEPPNPLIYQARHPELVTAVEDFVTAQLSAITNITLTSDPAHSRGDATSMILFRCNDTGKAGCALLDHNNLVVQVIWAVPHGATHTAV